ncbi:hypothetical protein [Thermomonas aquatica]|uniref:Uncharacterized protein n=1 Tax=Thermomonas aquatica TaxID=2202149 RepID=A0A5B7ZLP2_9GAMM|nr:hypothetical protein [Thermomonas aquatica]QDA56021.1 hypothetical protein FHQ07_01145 [Thermomonas aquatica]
MAITNPLDPNDDPNQAKKQAIASPSIGAMPRPTLVKPAAKLGAPATKPAIAAPTSTASGETAYAEGVRNSLGMRGVRALGDAFHAMEARRDASMANIGKAMEQAQPRPVAAPAPPAVAQPQFPGVRFAGVDPEPAGLFKTPASTIAKPPQGGQGGGSVATPTTPTTFRTGDGRTANLPAGISMRVGANGVREFSGTGETVAAATAAAGGRAPVGVTTQSVIPAPTFAPLGRPQVASTYGLSVNDPRIDEQQAGIARPNVAVRGPDAMAEQYNSREDREIVRKLISDNDSARFRQELVQAHGGRAGRAATAALGDIAGQQAQLASALSGQSSAAVQGRAGRDNQFDIASLQEAGQTSRADGARGSAERIAAMEGATAREGFAAEIARPRYDQDRAGNMIQIAGSIARPVRYEDGRAVQGQVAKANGEITAAMQYQALNDQLDTLMQSPPMAGDDAAKAAYDQRVAVLQQQINHLTSGAPAGMTLVGTKGGRPVYRDQAGNLHVQEQ